MLYRLYRWTLYLTIVRIWESSNYSFISKVCFGRVMLTLTLDLSAINRGLLAPGFGEANKVDVSGWWVFSSEDYLHLWHKWALHHCVSALEQESLRIWSIRLLTTFAILSHGWNYALSAERKLGCNCIYRDLHIFYGLQILWIFKYIVTLKIWIY